MQLAVPLLLLSAFLLGPCHAGKLITVSPSGNNSAACWSGSEPCLTLDFALGGLTESGTTVRVSYSHDFSRTTWTNVSEPLHDIALEGVGEPRPVINCTSLGVGVAFWGQVNVNISGIAWNGCSIWTPTSSMDNGTTLYAYRGLFFYNVTNLLIEDCQFSSLGRGAGVALYDVSGDVRIINTRFVNNTVEKELQCPDTFNTSAPEINCSSQGSGLYIELMNCAGFIDCSDFPAAGDAGVNNSVYVIEQCLFEFNDNFFSFHESLQLNFTSYYFRSFGHGGGIGMVVLGRSQGNDFIITNTQFANNSAYSGGGLYLLLGSVTQNNTVALSGSNFTDNRADGSGGGLTLGAAVSSEQHTQNRFVFQTLILRNNSAPWGGGVAIYFGNTSLVQSLYLRHGPTIEFHNSTWLSNSAKRVGAAVAAFHIRPINSSFTTSAYFQDCTFRKNQIPRVGGRTEHNGYGSIYSLAVPLSFNGTTLIRDSVGSALVISAAHVEFAGVVEFISNHGFVGSAIYLMDIAVLYLYKGLRMDFVHNDAFDTGGAIHYISPGARGLETGCLFQYQEPSLPPSQWEVMVTFSENKALYGGSAIYLSDPSGCHWPNGETLFDTTREHPLNFTGNNPERYGSVLGSPATNLSFLPPVNFTDGYYMLETMPGQPLDLRVSITDYFNSNSSSVIATLDTKCFNYSLFIEDQFSEDFCAPGTEITYIGPRVFVANTSITGITLGGPQNNSDLVLVLRTITVESQAIISVLRVSFTECSYGFYFDNDTKTCQCYDENNAVKCFSFNGILQPCILRGYWYGTIETSDGDTSQAETSCTLDACSVTCNESCLHIHGWCKLPAHDYDLCINHHGGPLCAYCLEGYSPNYGQLHCIPNDECNAGTSVLLVVLMVTFWAVIVIGLLLILRLNLRLGSGYMYGFIYYFSVLPFMARNVIQSHTFSAFLSLFYSMVHLDPHFLSFFRLCFARDITPVQLQFFHYFHPVLVTVIIYIVILINRYCPKVPILSVYAPIHALCLLLLLSYTSLFQTSFALLQPLYFTNAKPPTSNLYVRLQPRTMYFDPEHHLPYALVALVVELVIVLPFTILMLLAPWLMKWGKMTKFKPILDEFQACYKDRYRWFAGYYLLCRHLVALPPFFINAPSGTIFIQQIVNITILLIHAYVHPYRERWLNLLDTVFLFDLALVSILSGDTARTVFSGTWFDLKLGFKIVLIVIPCLYLVLASLVVFGLALHKWYTSKYKIRAVPCEGDVDNPDASSHSEDYEVISESSARRRGANRATVSVVSFRPFDTDSSSYEENPLLEHEVQSFSVSTAERPLDEDPPTQPSSSRSTSFLRRVASGLSSQVDYWRNTGGQSTRESYRTQMESLPELREDETPRI